MNRVGGFLIILRKGHDIILGDIERRMNGR